MNPQYFNVNINEDDANYFLLIKKNSANKTYIQWGVH